jgi:hypothetical protein
MVTRTVRRTVRYRPTGSWTSATSVTFALP